MRRQGKLSVSLMCADLLNLEHEIRTIETYGADYLHIDIMDGTFVPNLTFGPNFVKAIRKITSLPLDIHLLMDHPNVIIRALDICAGDIISIHSECGDNIAELADFIKEKNARFGLALNPDTSAESVREYFSVVDVVLLMLIVPGFAGRRMVDGIMDKVAAMRHYIDIHGFSNIEIEVDGSVSRERAAYMFNLGASIFVGGTAGIFCKGIPLYETIPAFKESLNIQWEKKGEEE